MDYCFAYVTCSNKREAEKIADALITEKLAACANIYEDVSSMYMWNGAVTKEDECVLMAKTKSKNFKTLTEKVCQMHSYSVPCVIQIPIAIGNQSYKEFVDNNTI